MLARERESTVALTYFCEIDEPDYRVYILSSDDGKWLYVSPTADIFFCLACQWVAFFFFIFSNLFTICSTVTIYFELLAFSYFQMTL